MVTITRILKITITINDVGINLGAGGACGDKKLAI